jgi:hypothetical protein
MKMESDEKLMDKMQLDYQVLDSGCCGMAGYFGYEAGSHYEVGKAAGERVLLPKVRNADANAIIIADGFSCREQIEQETERKGLHIAQVMQMALHQEKPGLIYPEKRYVDQKKLKKRATSGLLIPACLVASAALALFFCLKKK